MGWNFRVYVFLNWELLIVQEHRNTVEVNDCACQFCSFPQEMPTPMKKKFLLGKLHAYTACISFLISSLTVIPASVPGTNCLPLSLYNLLFLL